MSYESFWRIFGPASIIGLMWLFSTRPRLFIRIFVPREYLFSNGRQMLRGDNLRRGMRLVAVVSIALVVMFELLSL